MIKLESRKIGRLGRLVLPREFSAAQGWGPETVVTIYQDNGNLVIKLAESHEVPVCGGEHKDFVWPHEDTYSSRSGMYLDGGGGGVAP